MKGNAISSFFKTLDKDPKPDEVYWSKALYVKGTQSYLENKTPGKSKGKKESKLKDNRNTTKKQKHLKNSTSPKKKLLKTQKERED